MTDETKMKHAYFSSMAVEPEGIVAWRGVDGSEVLCNFIFDTQDASGLAWPDVVYRGPVTEFIRTVSPRPVVFSYAAEAFRDREGHEWRR